MPTIGGDTGKNSALLVQGGQKYIADSISVLQGALLPLDEPALDNDKELLCSTSHR